MGTVNLLIMHQLIFGVIWLILLPPRLVVLAGSAVCILALNLVGLGRAYICTIIKNIASNFFWRQSADLDSLRKRHTHILGATGSGKSSTIEYLIDQNIKKRQGFLLIEPHSELGDRVLHNKRFALSNSSAAYKNLMYLDFDRSPPPMNLFKLPLPQDKKLQASFIDGLATELADAFCMNMKPVSTEAQFIMLRNCLMACLYIRGATFNTLLDLLGEGSAAYLQRELEQKPAPVLQQYFRTDFQSSSTKRTKEALRMRLTNLVIPQSLFNSLCANECKVDFAQILERERFVIVKASTALLGSYQAQTVGNIIVNLLNKYAFERLVSAKQPKPFFVYLDEAQYYINPAVQRALTGVRKTGLNYTLAHQELCQEEMTPAAQKTIINNTAVKIYGQLQWKDRKEATAILGLDTAEPIEQLNPGQFILKAGNQAPSLRHFPSKFAVPSSTFGKGFLFNAYMPKYEYRRLSAELKAPVNEAGLLTPINQPVTDPKMLKQLSFNHFRLDGSKAL